jgi:hypothetical protein
VACDGTMAGQCVCFITLSGDGEPPSLMTISFIIPHLHVAGLASIYLRHWWCGRTCTTAIGRPLVRTFVLRICAGAHWAFPRTPT